VPANAYPIQTKRLLLRPLRADDAAAMYRYRSREDVCRYLMHPPQTLDGVESFIANARTDLTEENQGLTLGAVERDTGALVGDVVLFLRSREHRGGEIGYVLDPEYHGRGYATEASAALLRLGFDTYALHRIIGRLDARNVASARVLEKAGMRHEAHFVENEFLKGEWTDEVIFAVLAHEWRDPS
jgi:RimJ/RimL family protein N-acetyltransferase